MKNTKNWFKRSLAMLLVVVTLVGLVPANAIAAGADNSYIPGDVNSDGKVNAKDVNLTRRYIVGGYTFLFLQSIQKSTKLFRKHYQKYP